jgi:ABC-2 type transport system ATP-binding protein
MTEAAISINKLTKNYGSSRGISNVDLEVATGEVFGFIGPNGAGKSTTIRTMLDLIRPSSGSAKILGLDSRQHSVEIHRRVGYLAGDMETDPGLSGRQYLEYAASLRGGVSRELMDKYIKRLQCDTKKKIKHLSRGNKQKIGLVAALMHDPDLLILDEPTSGLDPLVQAEFNNIIKEQVAKGKTAFISSHILSEVQSICDRVGFIREGKLIKVQSVDSLINEAYRKVRVSFKKAPALAEVKALKGVMDAAATKDTITFSYHGEAKPLIKWLAGQDVTDVVIDEAHLEDVFMEYYEGDK